MCSRGSGLRRGTTQNYVLSEVRLHSRSHCVPELAMLIQPLRGPSRGAFRTGLRTREFDRWLLPPGSAVALDPDTVQQRLASVRIVLPIASLPWRVAFRTGALRPHIDPRHGPDWTRPLR